MPLLVSLLLLPLLSVASPLERWYTLAILGRTPAVALNPLPLVCFTHCIMVILSFAVCNDRTSNEEDCLPEVVSLVHAVRSPSAMRKSRLSRADEGECGYGGTRMTELVQRGVKE